MNAAALALPTSRQIVAIDAALLRGRDWRIALPGSLEGEYRQAIAEHRHQQLLRTGWLALVIFNSFLLVDLLMARDMFWQSVAVRLGLFTPFGVAVLVAARRHKALLTHAAWLDLTDFIVLVSGWAAAACLAFILLNSHDPMSMYYHAGFMVVILYGVLVQPVGFLWALLFGLGMLSIHLWSAWRGVQALPPPLQISLLHLLVSTVGLSLAASYLVEKARRRRFLLMRRDQAMTEQLAEVNATLRRLSQADVLTGVANRRHFREHLQQVWERAAGDGSPVSVLMLDVDHFKAYNDHHGHPAGDACLQIVASAVAEHVRAPIDFVARYGGEEFVAVLPGATREVALQVAERVRQGVMDKALPHSASPTARVVTVSVGVATSASPGLDCPDADRLVGRADRALYEAKRGARNRVQAFGDTPEGVQDPS
ncbi:MAG: hypothetical protein RLZZ182_1402 [Pseudomonadota bacterium]